MLATSISKLLSKSRSNNKGNRMFWPFQLFSLTAEEGLFGRNVLFPSLLLCGLLKELLIQLSQRSNEPLQLHVHACYPCGSLEPRANTTVAINVRTIKGINKYL